MRDFFRIFLIFLYLFIGFFIKSYDNLIYVENIYPNATLTYNTQTNTNVNSLSQKEQYFLVSQNNRVQINYNSSRNNYFGLITGEEFLSTNFILNHFSLNKNELFFSLLKHNIFGLSVVNITSFPLFCPVSGKILTRHP